MKLNLNTTSPSAALWGEDFSVLIPWLTTVFGTFALLGGGWLQGESSPKPTTYKEASKAPAHWKAAPVRSRAIVKVQAKPSAVVQNKARPAKPLVRHTVTPKPAPQPRLKPRLLVLASHTKRHVDPKECPPLFVLYFGKNKKKPFAVARKKWRKLVRWLRKHKSRTLVLRGFADGNGAKAYNLVLSYYRAQAVQSLLLEQGLPKRRIRVEARGNLQNRGIRKRRGNQRRVVLAVPGYESCERRINEEQL